MGKRSGGLLSGLVRARTLVAVGLLTALAPIMVGCYGEFPLTKMVYRVNGEVPTDLLRTVVFWALVIVPVYEVSMLVDAIVLNVIEFWTGTEVSVGATTGPDGAMVVFEPSADGREALLTARRDGVVVGRMRFVKVSETVCEVYDAQGKLAGMAIRTSMGDLRLTDAKGRVLTTLTADQLANLKGNPRPAPSSAL